MQPIGLTLPDRTEPAPQGIGKRPSLSVASKIGRTNLGQMVLSRDAGRCYAGVRMPPRRRTRHAAGKGRRTATPGVPAVKTIPSRTKPAHRPTDPSPRKWVAPFGAAPFGAASIRWVAPIGIGVLVFVGFF